jgi:hypothetical protein
LLEVVPPLVEGVPPFVLELVPPEEVLIPPFELPMEPPEPPPESELAAQPTARATAPVAVASPAKPIVTGHFESIRKRTADLLNCLGDESRPKPTHIPRLDLF